MSINYPSSLDTFTNPVGTNTLDSPSHSTQHTNANDGIEAIERVLGTNSGTSVIKDFNAGDFAVRVNSGGTLQQTLSGTVNNSNFGTPAINGGTISNSTLSSPEITGTVSGTTTFNTFPITAGTPTTDTQLANKLYVDNEINSISLDWESTTQTWTYASATTFTVSGDQTGTYEKGLKLKLTNDSAVKYFYVISSSYSSPNTTVTITGETLLASGAITLPYYSRIDKPSGFKKGEDWYKARAGANGTQSLTANTAAIIEIDTEEYDPNSNFDTSTYKYTCPITGYYHASGQVKIANMGTNERVWCEIYKNSSSYFYGNDAQATGSSSFLSSLVSGVGYYQKGDTIALRATCSGNRSTQYDGPGLVLWFSVQFVGI